MKKLFKSLCSAVVLLAFGSVALSAQSCAATNNSSSVVTHAGKTSTEAFSAAGASVADSAQVASAVVAVPLWIVGASVTTTGNALAQGGTAATEGADVMWDFATGNSTKRPNLNREKGVPPAPPKSPARVKDPSPAEVFKKQI